LPKILLAAVSWAGEAIRAPVFPVIRASKPRCVSLALSAAYAMKILSRDVRK